MPHQAPLPRSARHFVVLTILGAAVSLAAIWALALRRPPTYAGLAILAGAVLAVFFLQRHAFVVRWRGQRVALTLDEGALLFAFLAGPPAHAALALVVGVVAAQLVARRAPLKAAYNTAAYALAASAALGVYLGLGARALPPLAAVLPAALAYAMASNLLMSGLFARLEAGASTVVFRERFLLPTLIGAAVGASLALSAWALWSIHPFALLALAPLGALALLSANALTRLDREAQVRTSLAQATRTLVASPDEHALCEGILRECGDMFLAGRAEIALGRALETPRVWTMEFEGGADAAHAPIVAPLVASDEEIGTLRVFPARRAPTAKDKPLDAPLLALFASEAAVAIELGRVVRRYTSLHATHDRIVRHAPVGIVTLDAESRLVEVNHAFALAAQHPREAWAALLGEPELAQAIARLARGVAFQDLEVRLNGSVFDVAGVPLPPAPGEVSGGSAILFRDVSAKHAAAEAERKHSVTRPLVRRIVLEIIREGAVHERLLVTLGRRLAQETEARTAEEYATAFREMGLGDLRADGGPGGTFGFSADDLLERRPHANQPTCHLTRGFVEGVVEALEGETALGSEVRCQSRGHHRCAFVVKAKPDLVKKPVGRARV